MSINSFVLCSVDNTCVKAYPEWTTKIRNGCHPDTLLTTCEGVTIHFDVDAFLDLGVVFTPYIKTRLLEALSSDSIPLNHLSRKAILWLMDNDQCRLQRWQSYKDFDPNYITFNEHNHIVYAKGSNIDVIMDCGIKITPTMWCHMSQCDKEYACSHPNFASVTSEWSPLFRMTVLKSD